MILNRCHFVAALCATLAIAGCGDSKKSQTGDGDSTAKPVIRINIAPVGFEPEVTAELARLYMEMNDVEVEILHGPVETVGRLTEYQILLGNKASTPDVYQVDVIWIGKLGKNFINLAPYAGKELRDFFPSLISNNTLDGELVALPWYADSGVLFYRTDLLKKYGFEAPPKTWDELEIQARVIQDGERAAGDADFNGFVFTAERGEAITCTALEWEHSHGGGSIVDTSGTVTLNNANSIRAFSRAAKWIGTISPKVVLEVGTGDIANIFRDGNAAFMRNWSQVDGTVIAANSQVIGRYGVAPLPGEIGGSAATIGGWQLAVSKYSKHPKAAADFVCWMTSARAQKLRAVKGGYLPTRLSVYEDAEVLKARPNLIVMKGIFETAVPRPSTSCGDQYPEISALYSETVHRILKGEMAPAEALNKTSQQMKEMLGAH